MTMTEFHPQGEENPLLGFLNESDPETSLRELPESEPLSDPVPESERAQTDSPQPATDAAQNGASGPTGPFTGRGAGGPTRPAAGPAPTTQWQTDRELAARAQHEAIRAQHDLTVVENDLARTRKAMLMLSVSVIVACALVALVVLKQRRAQDGGPGDGPQARSPEYDAFSPDLGDGLGP